jgi:hypothetical protein
VSKQNSVISAKNLKLLGNGVNGGERKSQTGSAYRSLHSAKQSRHSQARSRTSLTQKEFDSVFKRQNKTKVEQHRRKIFDVVNNLNEEELEKISEMLAHSEA